MWSIGQPTPNFTLEGHDKGVNAVDYFTGGRPLLHAPDVVPPHSLRAAAHMLPQAVLAMRSSMQPPLQQPGWRSAPRCHHSKV